MALDWTCALPPDEELLDEDEEPLDDELLWVAPLLEEEVLDDELLWVVPLLDDVLDEPPEEVELDAPPTLAAWLAEELVELLPLLLLLPPQAASRRQGNTDTRRGADFITQSLLPLNQAAILETDWSPA